MKATNKFDILVTHSTTFHADDVFSTAFMEILNPSAELIRTLNVSIFDNVENAIVYDIGLGKYDHHQKDAEVRPNGIKYAAFGLLWREFGDWEQYPDFDEEFVQKIDEHDNGGRTFAISEMIRSFNMTMDENSDPDLKDDMYIAFETAVEIAKKYLIRIFLKYDEENKTAEFIKNNICFLEGTSIAIIPKRCNHVKYICKNYPECKVVVYSSERDGFSAKVMPISPDTMESIYTFPKEWCGQPKENLPENVTFVHNSGFLLVAKTCQDACEYSKSVKLKSNIEKD